MANLLHQNKNMTVFEALEVLETLESKENFVAGESVSTANVIIFPPKEVMIFPPKEVIIFPPKEVRCYHFFYGGDMDKR